jgi:hypothetical protein
MRWHTKRKRLSGKVNTSSGPQAGADSVELPRGLLFRDQSHQARVRLDRHTRAYRVGRWASHAAVRTASCGKRRGVEGRCVGWRE